jgi:hypothetical protein
MNENVDDPINHPDNNVQDTNGEVAGEDIVIGIVEPIVVDDVEEMEVIDVVEVAAPTVIVNDELNEEQLQTLDNFGIPKTIQHSPIVYGVTSDVWQFFHKLATPYHNKRQKTAAGSTHICMLCLGNINEKTKKSLDTWKNALKKPVHAQHAREHIKKKHTGHPRTKKWIEDKAKEFDKRTTLGISQSPPTLANPSNLEIAFNNASTYNVRQSIFQWIVYENIPFNAVQSEYFKQMFRCIQPSFVSMSRDTFIDLLNREFEDFVGKVVILLDVEKNNSHGVPIISVCHDMWTTINNDNVLGSSVRLITKDFDLLQIACLLTKNNITHGAEWNAITLQEEYLNRYGVELSEEVKYMTSDTASAARAVSGHVEDMDQVDCEMHVVNLALLYAIGLRENVKNVTYVDNIGTKRRVRTIVTPGGAFPEGLEVIQKLRNLAKYFGTGQRKQRLVDKQDFYDIPHGLPQIDGLTRVASVCKLFQTSIQHYYGMLRLYTDLKEEDDIAFVKLFDEITEEDWELIAEMESLTFILVSYALGEAQMDKVMASKSFYFRSICKKYCTLQSFDLMKLTERPMKNDTIKCWKRRSKTINSFTDTGKKCLQRLSQQLDLRFKYEKPEQFLPVFLDPVTCPLSDKLIPTEYFAAALAHFKQRHFEVYEMYYDVQYDNQLEVTNVLAEEIIDDNDPMGALDWDLEIQTNNMVTTSARDKADQIIDLWLSDTVSIEWKRYIKVAQPPILPNTVTTVFGRMCNCDILAWFKKVGGEKFPTISLLARSELGKMSNSGYQERVFSSANGAMNKKQGRMGYAVLEKRTLLFHNKDFISKYE